MRNAVTEIFNRMGIEAAVLPSVPLLRKYRFEFTPRSTIVAVFPYLVPKERGSNLCRYAVVPDYHVVVGNYLKTASEELARRFPEGNFNAFVDNSPVSEVYAAASAGLGVIGLNGLLITPRWGSYVFIGCIVTDQETDGVPLEPRTCTGCGACQRVCPGNALHNGEPLDKSVCLSALTQKKGALNNAEEQKIRQNGLVWGCDTCQSVCPLNKAAEPTKIPEFIEGVRQKLVPGDLAEDLSDRAYLWRGKNVLRRNLEIFKELW